MAELNKITEGIIGAAIEVHRALGHGLLESAYLKCLAFELTQRGHKTATELPLPLVYKDGKLDCSYRLDLLVDDAVIVEMKPMETLAPIQEAQPLSYLKLADCKPGLLINFNVRMPKNGIKRFANCPL